MASTENNEAVSSNFWFIVIAYAAAFAPWTAILAKDFISAEWRTVKETRQAGYRNLIWCVPALYVLAYCIFQGLAQDYTEMSAALVALAFALMHAMRTFWGLWQLNEFRKWAEESVLRLQSVGVPYTLPKVRKKTQMKDEYGNSPPSIADHLLVNEKIIDNQIMHGEVQCSLKFGNTELLRPDHGLFLLWPALLALKWMLIPFALMWDVIMSRKGGSGTRRFQLVPIKPAEVWVHWAATFASQGLKTWMSDFRVVSDPEEKPIDLSQSALDGLHERGRYFAAEVLASAALQLWPEHVPCTSKLNPFLWHIWEKESEMKDGRMTKQELLKTAVKSGLALPFDAPQFEDLLDSEYVTEEYLSYDLYRDILREFIAELPVKRVYVNEIRKFDVEMLEWLTILLHLGAVFRQTYDDFELGESSDSESQEIASRETSLRGQAVSNLLSQVNCTERSSTAQTTNGDCKQGVLSGGELNISAFPMQNNWFWVPSHTNRLVTKVGEVIDVWLALVSGEQLTFVVEKLNLHWKSLCLGPGESGAFPSTNEMRNLTDRVRGIHGEVEKRRLQGRIADQRYRYRYADQFVTFMGYKMESVRTCVARWVHQNSRKSDELFGTLEPESRDAFQIKFRLTELTADALKGKVGMAGLKNRGVQSRLIWELQCLLDMDVNPVHLFSYASTTSASSSTYESVAPGVSADEESRTSTRGSSHSQSIELRRDSSSNGGECSSSTTHLEDAELSVKAIMLFVLSFPSLQVMVQDWKEDVVENGITRRGDIQDDEHDRQDGCVTSEAELPHGDIWVRDTNPDCAGLNYAAGQERRQDHNYVAMPQNERGGTINEDLYFNKDYCCLDLRALKVEEATAMSEKAEEDAEKGTGEKKCGCLKYMRDLLLSKDGQTGSGESIENDNRTNTGSHEQNHNSAQAKVEIIPVCGPQDFSVIVHVKASGEGRLRICGHGNEFRWRLWRDAFLGRLQGFREWQEEFGVPTADLTVDKDDSQGGKLVQDEVDECCTKPDEVRQVHNTSEQSRHVDSNDARRCAPDRRDNISVGGQNTDVAKASEHSGEIEVFKTAVNTSFQTWREWYPFRAGFCRFELESEGLLLQPFTIDYHDFNIRSGKDIYSIGSYPIKEIKKVAYGVAGDVVLRHASLLVRKTISRGVRNAGEEEVQTNAAEALKSMARRTRDCDEALMLYESAAIQYRDVEALRSCMELLTKGDDESGHWRAFEILQSKVSMMLTKDREYSTLCDSSRESMERDILPLWQKLAERWGDRKGAATTLFKILDVYLLGDVSRHHERGHKMSQHLLFLCEGIELPVGILSSIATFVGIVAKSEAEDHKLCELLQIKMTDKSSQNGGEGTQSADVKSRLQASEDIISRDSGVSGINFKDGEFKTVDSCSSARASEGEIRRTVLQMLRAENRRTEWQLLENAMSIGDRYSWGDGGDSDVGLESTAQMGQWIDPNQPKALVRLRKDKSIYITALQSLAVVMSEQSGGVVPTNACRAVELYMRAVDMGDVPSMYNLANLLVRGAEGVTADAPRAMELYSRAVSEGHIYAMNNLANMLRNGAEGVPVDSRRAMDLYTRAADEGHGSSMINLAHMLRSGAEGVPADAQRARDLFMRAVSDDQPEAMFGLAVLLQTGADGVPADASQAKDLYAQAVAGGHVDAMCNLACLLQTGDEGVPRDVPRAVELFIRAVNEGHVYSMYRLASLLWEGDEGVAKDAPSAVELYQQAVNEGHVDSMFRLGFLLWFGDEGVPTDAPRAVELYQQAVSKGHVDSMYRLACALWLGGEGVVTDAPRAVELFQQAVNEGHVDSMCGLASLLWDGDEGVPTNAPRAVELYQQAVNEGHIDSMYYLARALWDGGEGVPMDAPRAVELYEQAVNEGHVDSTCRLASLLWNGDEFIPTDAPRAVELYQKAVNEGHVGSMYRLASSLWDGGENVPRDAPRAVKLYQQAVNEGHVPAMYRLACALWLGGEGIVTDAPRAEELFQQAVNEGDVSSMCGLASLLWDGDEGVPTDAPRAVELYQQAVDEGHVKSMFRLACSLWEGGEGVPRDAPRAVELYQRAVNEGHVDSMLHLAGAMLDGGEGVPRDAPRAVELYEQAVNEGHVDSMCDLASLLWDGDEGVPADAPRAVELYQQAVNEGHVDSMFHLAGALLDGGEGVPTDAPRAVELYEQAVNEGHVVAMHDYAGLLLDGAEGVAVNARRSKELYIQAVNEGHVDAMVSLAQLLQKGAEGVSADPHEAVELYKRAIDNGSEEARFYLADLMDTGAGEQLKRDHELAVKYYEEAIELDDDGDALFHLSRLLLGAGDLTADVGRAVSVIRQGLERDMEVSSCGVGALREVWNIFREGTDEVERDRELADAIWQHGLKFNLELDSHAMTAEGD